jgi:hypothetical protein
MSTDNAPAEAVTAPPPPAKPTVAAPPSWPWLRGALILAGAAQLITISALVGPDGMTVTWATLLLAIAPAPLAAAAAFASASVARLAAAAAVAAMAAGLGGSATHTGLFFLPGLVVEIVAAAKLWAERGEPAAGGQRPSAASPAPMAMNSEPAATNARSAERPQRP